MDFFAHQSQALRRTTLLVVLFVLALFSLIALLNLLLAFFFINTDSRGNGSLLTAISIEQWLSISALVITVVGGASLYRWFELQAGGKAVAQSLGGRLLDINSADFYERRLLNIVAEIALAAGVPVPPVYVLEDNSINAFAAGYKSSDAVIGVTRGCMQKLSRDQLQGVIAHEFSHIFNGDMRLNIRIMAVLFGILFIGLIGRMLIEIAGRSSRRSSKDNSAFVLLALGIALIVIGYCGVFFGNLIKAAVSRQREFLADASAVQFTRNPDGIAGALKIIGQGAGSVIASPKREETAHLFFGNALPNSFMSLFATHPPLTERIRRIEPQWNGQFDLQPQTQTAAIKAEQAAGISGFSSAIATAASTEQTLNNLHPDTTVSAAATYLERYALQADAAPLLMFALLIEQTTSTNSSQLQLLSKSLNVEQYQLLQTLQTHTRQLHYAERLPLVELAIPALKEMSAEQYKVFYSRLKILAMSDLKLSVFEWCMLQMIQLYLQAHFNGPDRRFETTGREKQLSDEISHVLSIIALQDQQNAEAAFKAGCIMGGFTIASFRPYVNFKQLDLSLHQLGRALPHIKGRLLKAMYAAAEQDGIVRIEERDLIKTIAAIIEIPAMNSDPRFN